MKKLFLDLLMAAAVAFLGGCVTAPAPQDQIYSAHYVGDRASISLSEVVLTIQLRQANGHIVQNLHVQFDAIVNPKDRAVASVYDVNSIVRRLEPRIRARITDLVPAGKSVAFQELSAVKEEIARAAAATFSEAYTKWTKAPAFEVEIVVASFYLTDLSVGVVSRTRSIWW